MSKFLHRSKLFQLVQFISTLPGLGSRSGMRIALDLLLNKDRMQGFIELLIETQAAVQQCIICGNLAESAECSICIDTNRDQGVICVVESVADVIAIEKANFYNGVYHVLHGKLSTTTGITPHKLNINSLLNRIIDCNVMEVIIASSSTTEGQTTTFFLMDELENILKNNPSKTFKITTLAKGMPLGSELDYLDEGTIIASLKSRTTLI